MRFKFGARFRSGQYTVRASHSIIDPLTKRVEHTKPIRIHIKEHTWDSVQAQKEFQWTDAERIEAENYLKNHPDFGKVDGRGIFIDQTISQMSIDQQTVLEQNRQMQGLKEALAGAPATGTSQMVSQLLDQAAQLLKIQGVTPEQNLVVPGELTEEPKTRICIQMKEQGDDSVQCSNPAIENGDFCATCQQEIDDEVARQNEITKKGDAKEEEPVPAGT